MRMEGCRRNVYSDQCQFRPAKIHYDHYDPRYARKYGDGTVQAAGHDSRVIDCGLFGSHGTVINAQIAGGDHASANTEPH